MFEAGSIVPTMRHAQPGALNEDGRRMVEYPAVKEGRLRWTETNRDTLDSGLVVTSIKDLVTQQRYICVQSLDGSVVRLRIID